MPLNENLAKNGDLPPFMWYRSLFFFETAVKIASKIGPPRSLNIRSKLEMSSPTKTEEYQGTTVPQM